MEEGCLKLGQIATKRKPDPSFQSDGPKSRVHVPQMNVYEQKRIDLGHSRRAVISGSCFAFSANDPSSFQFAWRRAALPHKHLSLPPALFEAGKTTG